MNFLSIVVLLCMQVAMLFGESPLVSVITPTYNREDRLPNLYKAFCSQTYENKELLVLDDSPQASEFFTQLKDPRVTYWHIPHRATIGGKRNQLIEKAKGEIIAQFDDDDYYAPNYLATMTEKMGDADLIKLSTWLIWRENDQSLWEWDTGTVSPIQFQVAGNTKQIVKIDPKELQLDTQNNIEANLWGYGFSYVFRKSLWQAAPFDDMNFGEDIYFIRKAQNAGKKLVYIPDANHMVLHTLHKQSTSRVFPQVHHDTALAIKLLGPGAEPWLEKQ
jgi:glycosyltransferase involved in cell wall biosynthesis